MRVIDSLASYHVNEAIKRKNLTPDLSSISPVSVLEVNPPNPSAGVDVFI